MADLRLRHGWIMLVFLVIMMGGAALMTSDEPGQVRTGIALILMPLAATGVLLGLFYWKSRRE